MPPTVVLDTSVLYPTLLRDVLLRCAEKRLFDVRWSARIIDELQRNLIRDAKLNPDQANRLITDMSRAFPFAQVSNVDHLISGISNHPKDRHVAAVAVLADASTIVTSNLRHFRPEDLAPHGVVAMSPDDFLGQLLPASSAVMATIIHEMVQDYNNPPVSVDRLLTSLGRSVPTFANHMLNSMGGEQREASP